MRHRTLITILMLTAMCSALGAASALAGPATPLGDQPRSLASPHEVIPGLDKAGQLQTALSIAGAVDFDLAQAYGADYLQGMAADITEDNAGNGNPDVPDDPDDGGWDWSTTTFSHSTGASPTNIYGATAMGLYHTYLESGGVGYLLAMTDAADTMINNPNVRSGADLVYLMLYNDLPAVAGTAYEDSARAKYDARITTYGSAQAFAEYIRDVRGASYPNGIIPWDIGIWVRAAVMLDARFPGNGYDTDADDMAEVIYQDSYMDNPGYFDIVDDAGWDPTYADVNFYWYNLGITGLIDAFDAAGVHTGEIAGLVTLLLDGQAGHGGISFSYGANPGDEDWQSTAYAMMTLGRLDQATYQSQLNEMGYFLAATQDVSGAWVYSSGNHYPEIGGEATAGLYFTTNATTYDLADAIVDDDFTWQGDVDLYNDANGTNFIWGYDAFATIQEAMAIVDGSTIYVVAGTYYETLNITLDNLTILGEDRATVIIDPTGLATNNAGIYVDADNVILQSLTLQSTVTNSLPRYGIKFGEVDGCTLEDVTVRDVYRSGIDALGSSNLTVYNVSSLDNGGHGLSLVDCNGVAVTDIAFSGNGWQNVSVATWGRYSPLGTSGIVFDGTNSFGDLFQLEMGDYNNPGVPPAGAAIITYSTNILDGADVTVQASDFGFALHGEQDDSPDQVRIWFFSTLANAAIIPPLAPIGHWTGNDMYIESLTDGTQLYVTPGGSIQAAIDAADPGDDINVTAGTYVENIDVHTLVHILGAGSGSDPASNTIITQTTGGAGDTKVGVVQLTTSGASAVDPILFQDLRIAADGMAGFSVGRFCEATGQNISYIELDNVFVIGNNVNPNTEQERGLYVDLTSSLTYLVVTDCAFDNLTYGWYLHKEVSADASTVQYVDVTNTTFNHNNLKGIYAEKLSDVTFDGCTVSENGFSDVGVPSYFLPWMAGFDINLKAGTYANLIFNNCTVTDNALGGAKEGVGLTVKGRGTGNNPSGSYVAFPAWVDNVVITGGTYTGNERGMRFGEPGKENASPTNVDITDADVHSNVQTYVGSDGSAYGDVVNQMMAGIGVVAEENWWGTYDYATILSQVSGEVDFDPWCLDDTHTYCTLTYPVTEVWVDDDWAGSSAGDIISGHVFGYDAFATIQDGIDGVTGSTVNVAAGTYVEALLIDKPLTLLGATAGVNKNGYTVPAAYAWDDAVESIIMHPDPAGGYVTIVDIYDTDDVTFDGFVVQELSASGNLNTSLLRVYAHSRVISNIEVVNSILGPNTNTVSQDGTHGRMGLYIINHPYNDNGVTNSTFAGNKIFDCKGNGNNIFLWTSYYAYGAPGPASMAGTVIEDNEIYGSHRSGIETAGGFSDLVIRNNEIYGNSELPGDDPGKLKYGHGILLIRGSSDKVSDPLTAYGPVDLTIEGNNIYGNSKSGIYMGPKNDGVTIINNAIQDNGWNGVIVDLVGNYWNPQFEPAPADSQYACFDCSNDITAFENTIYGNGTAGNPVAEFGVQVNGDPTNDFVFDASGNWWGSTDAATIAGLAEGAVDYTPWLASGTDTDPGTLGFQGDFATLYVDDDSPQAGSETHLIEAIGLVTASTIYMTPGTYSEGPQVVVASDLTIIGDDPSTVTIVPTTNTGSSGDARGWFLVNAGITLDMSHVTLDGAGFDIYQGIRHKGSGTLDDIAFLNIVYPGYGGVAVAAFGGTFVTISNSSFANIGRVGALMWTNGVFTGNTYTGKGDGDWLDYSVDMNAGVTVDIFGNTISGCTGVASSDGSTSAGFLVTTYYGAGTTANLEGNTVTECTAGIAIGYDEFDASTLTVTNGNRFLGNEYGITTTASASISLTCYGNVFGNTYNAADDAGGTWDDGVSIGNCWLDFDANPGYPTYYLVGGDAGSIDNYPSVDCGIDMAPDDILYHCGGSFTFDVSIGDAIADLEAGRYYFEYPAELVFESATALDPNFTVMTNVTDNATGVDILVVDFMVGTGSQDGPADLYTIELSGSTSYCTGEEIAMTADSMYDGNNVLIECAVASPIMLVADCDDPIFTVSSPAGGGFYNTVPVLDLGATDNCDIDAIYYQIDGCTELGWTAITGPGYSGSTWSDAAWVVPGFAGMTEEEHCLRFKVIDDNELGNSDSCTYAWCFTKDVSDPSPPSDFIAEPGHNKVKLAWTSSTSTDVVGYRIQRVAWGDYPLYTPPGPTYPVDEYADVNVFDGAGNAHVDTYLLDNTTRDVYYYAIFAYDAAGNYSMNHADANARSTSYWLGDIADEMLTMGAYDGYVLTGDLYHLAATYWYSTGDAEFEPEADWGPTADSDPKGIPTPDGTIGIYDLSIFAINYGAVNPTMKTVPLFASQKVHGPLDLTLSLEVVEGQVVHRLFLNNSDGQAKTLHVVMDCADATLVSYQAQVEAEVGGCPVFAKARQLDEQVEFDFALIGNGATIGGSGELATFVFSSGSAIADVNLVEAIVLDNSNQEVPVALINGAKNTAALPGTYTLSQNYPNPFNPTTQIAYQVPNAGHVTIEVFNLVGQRVRTLVDNYSEAGNHVAIWHGTDGAGRAVSSGVYFYRMTADGFVMSRKMMLVK